MKAIKLMAVALLTVCLLASFCACKKDDGRVDTSPSPTHNNQTSPSPDMQSSPSADIGGDTNTPPAGTGNMEDDILDDGNVTGSDRDRNRDGNGILDDILPGGSSPANANVSGAVKQVAA